MNLHLKFILGTVLLAVGLFHPLNAQTASSANQLEIGPTSSNQVYNDSATYSGAIGESNSVNMPWSLAVGSGNYINATGSFAFGYSNQINGGGYSMLVGDFNANYGMDSLIVGTSNTIATDEELGSQNYSAMIGGYNYSYGSAYSLTVGRNNGAYSQSGLTAGQGLINGWNRCAVVGQYNFFQSGASLYFVVGNGADATHRSNALEVYSDGVVILPKRQGDIGMGRFGNTADQ